MRSPVRAVERQCTRRRSSPSSYSRSVTNSSPRSLTTARGTGFVLGADPAPDRDRRHDVVHARAHDQFGFTGAGLAAPRDAERVGHRERRAVPTR